MPDKESLLQFPCEFPIKALGKNILELDLLVIEIVRRHSPEIKEDSVKTRPSRGGKYIAVTITITATSQKQLDAIYQDLTNCPEIIMAL